MKKKYLNLLLLLLFYWGHAQIDSTKVIELEPVVVESTRISSNSHRIPLAISTLYFTNTQDSRQQLSLKDYISSVPGVYAVNSTNFSQDLRISIRGYGARSAFGIRGIKILVDGIPETTPDGQGQIDNLNLGVIDRIEIIRGPSASLYGNASGGVLSIYTNDNIDKDYLRFGMTYGNDAMSQYQTHLGIQLKKAIVFVQGTSTKTDGYREQSNYKNNNLNLKIKQKLSDRTLLNWHLNYNNSPYARDPGGLNEAELNTNRRMARLRNIEYNTHEQIEQFKSAINLRHQWKDQLLNTYAFFSNRDFKGLLPFNFGGWIQLKRNYMGFGTSYTLNSISETKKSSLQLGIDLASQNDNRKRFKNEKGKKGDPTLDQLESFHSLGLFALYQLSYDKFLVRTGLRFDINKLEVDDRFSSDGIQSDKIKLDGFNPSFGLSYELIPKNFVFMNISTSFETPVLSELTANPSQLGGFNKELKSQKSTSYELGYKFNTRHVTGSLTVFTISNKNDIVPFELEAYPDRDFYRNAGASSRNGIETSLLLQLTQYLRLDIGYTFSDFAYETYKNSEENFEGNHLPGIPLNMASIDLQYQTSRLNFRFSNQYVGKVYVNDANSVKDSDYFLSNLNVGYEFLAKNFTISPFVGINNLFDSVYNDNIRINAFGGRYYEPAPGMSIFGGIRLSTTL